MNNQMLTVRLKLSYVQVKKGWGGGVGEDMGRLENKQMWVVVLEGRRSLKNDGLPFHRIY